MADSTVTQALRHVAKEQGWRVTNSGEAIVALALRRLGYDPRRMETQFNLGPYKLDFALVAERIDIEADGWVHTAKDVRKRDRERDRRVRSWGWTVIRIDLGSNVEEQLERRVPKPSTAAEYVRAIERIRCEIDLALFFMSRRTGREPAECIEHIRKAIQVTCQNISRRRRPPDG